MKELVPLQVFRYNIGSQEVAAPGFAVGLDLGSGGATAVMTASLGLSEGTGTAVLLRSLSDNDDNVLPVVEENYLGAVVRLTGFDSDEGVWNRLLTAPTDSDDVPSDDNSATLATASFGMLFNAGFTPQWVRQRSGGVNNLGTFQTLGSALVTTPGERTIIDIPPAASAAEASRPAAVGASHICRAITVSLGATANQAPIIATLRDGEGGVGTILWAGYLAGVAGTSATIALSSLNIVGTAGNAMTLEVAAPAATNLVAATLVTSLAQ